MQEKYFRLFNTDGQLHQSVSSANPEYMTDLKQIRLTDKKTPFKLSELYDIVSEFTEVIKRRTGLL